MYCGFISIKQKDSLAKVLERRGIGSSEPLDSRRMAQIRFAWYKGPVRDRDCSSKGLWHRLCLNELASQPFNSRSTVATPSRRTGTHGLIRAVRGWINSPHASSPLSNRPRRRTPKPQRKFAGERTILRPSVPNTEIDWCYTKWRTRRAIWMGFLPGLEAASTLLAAWGGSVAAL